MKVQEVVRWQKINLTERLKKSMLNLLLDIYLNSDSGIPYRYVTVQFFIMLYKR